MKKYDYLVVGAGLYGAVFAHEVSKRGKSCLVIDKRNHVGGNIYCENIEGINVHKYGAHIFHTNDEEIWNYVNEFAEFNRFTNSPIANFNGEIYNLPFNMNTFNKLWGVITPQEAKDRIEEQKAILKNKKPENLEEQAISLVGTDIYEKLIKGYTEKQWGRSATELPPFIIKRLPVRFTYDNNYFNDRYQGIPIGGYNVIIENLLRNCDIRLNTNYFENREELDSLAKKVLFTGMIDEYYGYKYGVLEYRSLRFDTELLQQQNYQGNAVVNYTDRETPFTRIIEHKHFEFKTSESTVITREYPMEWKSGDEPYYPVLDEKNLDIYNKYKALGEKEETLIFGGRLGEYKYYDMHNIVRAAIEKVKEEFKN
ncbi:UDP-galactopyranose mutase [Clostridium punense]|uniref:UDP-galactopyranose mutase n=1 Tax=Clostridium punense TaxID=1054297 RepID=A0ABS4K092_9CLOT|nr:MULTISPECIES: UDP-galactopyranose mutase [Clostridium]EQB90263.1 UDP-galactopyranose mutase [Clostridium sp. BL8]MBP2021190.1 UDP-galactopyranose mutase [Clostridium punense]